MILRIPLLWRFIGGEFLKVFLFSTLALILCLLTLRMEEIAHFASIDQSREYLVWFVLYQVPYILPIAIPLSCLISSTILMQRLSGSHEISALRALGHSLKSIFAPIILLATLIALLNLFITSEVATFTHLQTNRLKAELRSLNPLLLLHNKHLLRSKGIFFDALGATRMGEIASDVIVAMPGKKGGRLNIFLAKKLESKGDDFAGEGLTLLTTPDATDKVLIENIRKTRSDVDDFSDLLQKKVWTLHDDYLGFKFLLLRLGETRSATLTATHEDLKKGIKTENRLLSEMARRLSLGLAPFTFTLMGLSFGLSIGRRESRRGIIWVTGLAALFLTTFFLAKGSDTRLAASLSLYFIPHILIVIASLFNLRKISLGID